MPLVFAENERSVTERGYDDQTGVSYEYPKQYRKRVREGERFVYYRGGRRADGSRKTPEYYGAGIVGTISPSRRPGHLVCKVHDYTPFAAPIPFKDQDRAYLEPQGARSIYFRQGVRVIDEATYQRILRHAEAIAPTLERAESQEDAELAQMATWNTSPESIVEIDRFAVRIAIQELQRRFPGQPVVEQPHSNPGFDVLVGRHDRDVRYVEVKGTQWAMPRFLLSEGQRRLSMAQPDRFILLVVYDIDLSSGRHKVWVYEGPINEARFTLMPLRWLVDVGRQ